MWVDFVCEYGLVLYRFLQRLFILNDAVLDHETSHANALFAVAKRLEKLYHGSKVYVGLQIPDQDSGSRRNIDLVVVTNQEAVVISVKNVGGFVSVDKDGNWVCTDGKNCKTESISNPPKPNNWFASLKSNFEQRGVDFPEGYLSFKVICSNPNISCIDPYSFPPEVITNDRWTQLKPEQRNMYAGWMKGGFICGKKKMQESFCKKLNSVLRTAPVWDRLELNENKYILGEFLEFKGKQEDLHALRKIRRSKVSLVTVQKMCMFGFAHSTAQLLYAPRDYRVKGSSKSSQWEEVTVSSSTELLFLPQNSTRPHKFKLSSVISVSLSA